MHRTSSHTTTEPLIAHSPFPDPDTALVDTNEALAVLIATCERAQTHPGFFADTDESGELERSLDAVRALLHRRRDFAALVGGEPFSDL